MDEEIMEQDVVERILDGSSRPTDLKLSAIRSITGNFYEGPITGTAGFGTIYKISPFSEDDMLRIEPLELHFTYMLNSPVSCSLELTNETNSFMAFHVQTTSPLPYYIQPNKGIVAPQSKYSVNITLRPLDKVPQDKDPGGFIVRSTKINEGLINEDITEDIFERDVGNLVDEVTLAITYKHEVPKMGYKINDLSKGSKPDHLTLQHLKDITENFSNERIVGRGGFGMIYRGVLPNGEVVAVKKLLQARRISQKQFFSEVTLMKLDHPNIVRLVGYCYQTHRLLTPREGKFVIAWNIESFLCLEYVKKGSLDQYISDASYGLDWKTRWKVIEGICFGLKHLHEQSNGPIIHMDLKPANILLDENMEPKIADFGLSRLLYKKHTISIATTSGTLGYMPPEYLQGIITPKSDIFSLGVIIMEVITGHREYPSDVGTSFVRFVELELKKWINRLQGGPDYTSLEMCCQQIKRCIQIGVICVNPDRTKRPTMKQIINMLQGLESTNLYIGNKKKIVLKLELDDERKKRKAFKAAVGMLGVNSVRMDEDKITIVGDDVDPVKLTTMLRRKLGHAELLSVSSGDAMTQPYPIPSYGYSYPEYSYPDVINQHQEQEPGCSIM